MAFIPCPLCGKRYPNTFIAHHASTCDPSRRHTIRKRKLKVGPPKRLSHFLAAKTDTSSSSLSSPFPSHPGTVLPVPSTPTRGLPSESDVPGFLLFPAIFTPSESAALYGQAIAASPDWSDYRFRLAKNYGPPYNLSLRTFLFGSDAPVAPPLPQYATHAVLPRLCALTPLLQKFSPNQLTAGLYRVVPGARAHILPHNDCENAHIGTAVVGVCLGARCTMTLILRRGAGAASAHKEVKRDVVLPVGAVYVMAGDALRVWQHAIFPGKTDATRLSLTFRDISPHRHSAPTAAVADST